MARTTLVIVPRERFSLAIQSIDDVYQNTHVPFDLVYVDGGSPAPVRDAIVERSRRYGFEIIRTEDYLFPHRARNLGWARAKTEYVMFLDNDVFVVPGWLDALVRCADETQAAVVGPLYLEGPPDAGIVHMAGGIAHIEVEEGRRVVKTEHTFQRRKVDEVGPLVRGPTELAEFHGVLIRRSVLEAMGGFDEGLKNTREHIDFCMSVRERGETVYFEPAARIAYLRPPPFAWSDLPFFMLRWSEVWTRDTLTHYHAKWDLDMDETDHALTWVKKHRYRFLEPVYQPVLSAMFATLGRKRTRRLLQRLMFPIEGVVNRTIVKQR